MTSVMKDLEEKIRAFERQEAFEEGKEEGREEGRLLNMFDVVKAVRRSLGLPDDEIRRILNISAEDWAKLQTMA